MRQGDFLVTVVSDGYISVPEDIVTAGADPAGRASVTDRLPKVATGVLAHANIPVLQTGSEIIVFDVGGGGRYQVTEGRFAANLAAAGIAPPAVTKIVLTHAHPDHVWGLRDASGAAAFANAAYCIGQTEWDFWMGPQSDDKMPAMLHGFVDETRRALRAIAERVCLLQDGQDVSPGIRAIATPGHTPGHLSFEVTEAEGLLIAADVATSSIVSFEHPEWVFGFDAMPEAAIQSRTRFLDRAATDRTRMIGYHWPYPGLGRADRHAHAFRFVAGQ